MTRFLQSMLILGSAELVLAVALTMLGRAGTGGRWVMDRICRAPWVDGVLALLTWVPWVVGAAVWGWPGLGGALLGQVAALYLWIGFHELLHRGKAASPRLVTVHHRLVGPWPNQLSLWLTVVGVPVLWLVRVLEIFFYPLLILLLDFPRYRQSEWVNLSRHKVQDLVGHDLAWCLYCDWMTGVWSLGSEILRNIESFWCPIQFPDKAKCRNSRVDFPDSAAAWTPAEAPAPVAEAAALLEVKYGDGKRSWFGHPERRPVAPAPHGQALDDLDDLHRDVLLEHSQRPRNHRAMDDATHRAEGHLPGCDDRVTVYVRLDGGVLADVSFQAQACPICTASASLMTRRLHGCTPSEATALFETFHAAMLQPESPGADLGDLSALAGVRQFPARVKCATLPWHTLHKAMKDGVAR